MNTNDLERRLVDSVADDTEFGRCLDWLLFRLLAEVPGYSARATDGVIIAHLHRSGSRVVASGVVIMIEQTVEPIRVELTLDESGRELSSGLLHFGDTTTMASCGLKKNRQLQNAILANPAVEFPWKARFHRDGHGWHYRPRMIPFEELPADNAELCRVGVEFRVLDPDTPESCPVPLEDVVAQLRLESPTVHRKQLRFLRTAQVEELRYWIWSVREAEASPRFVAVAVAPDGVARISLQQDHLRLTPEQFMLGEYHRLF